MLKQVKVREGEIYKSQVDHHFRRRIEAYVQIVRDRAVLYKTIFLAEIKCSMTKMLFQQRIYLLTKITMEMKWFPKAI